MKEEDRVLLAHGSGGVMMKRIIDEVFAVSYGQNLNTTDDAAVLPAHTSRIAFSTDSFVVTPRFFPGGDIGRLAVCGTVNDVATSGAHVVYLSASFILEEGLSVAELRRVCDSMAQAAKEADVAIVTGDTKVVDKGLADGIFINTTGVGLVPEGVNLSSANCQPGDVILLSGTLGDHGIAIISQREGLAFSADIASDAAPLNHLVASVLAAAPHTRCFRDPTRGGLSSTLNEFAEASKVHIVVEEEAVPVHTPVQGACEMLGLDVFQVANEGKMVCVVPAEEGQAALAAMQADEHGAEAAIIGHVEQGDPRVVLHTAFGSSRILDPLVGEQLPRIC